MGLVAFLLLYDLLNPQIMCGLYKECSLVCFAAIQCYTAVLQSSSSVDGPRLIFTTKSMHSLPTMLCSLFNYILPKTDVTPVILSRIFDARQSIAFDAWVWRASNRIEQHCIPKMSGTTVHYAMMQRATLPVTPGTVTHDGAHQSHRCDIGLTVGLNKQAVAVPVCVKWNVQNYSNQQKLLDWRTFKKQILMSFTMYSTLCFKKCPTYDLLYNLDIHNPVALIFGRSVTKKVRNQMMLCFPTSPIQCFCTTLQNRKPRKCIFSLQRCMLLCQQTHKTHSDYYLVAVEPTSIPKVIDCMPQIIKTYLEREYSILLSVTHMLCAYQVRHDVCHCVKDGSCCSSSPECKSVDSINGISN